MSSSIDIELRSITKDFDTPRDGKNVRAVDNVSLQISHGEFFALLGPSGCGKTTTLRMIAGFEVPTAGEILIRGQAVQDVPPFHRPVNTVFQDYALFPHMTVLDNVMFGLQMEKVQPRAARERALQALDLVQLPQVADRKPAQLSGGQQQRVALARALVKEPAVLLLDEPLGALDLKLRKAMQYELKAMQQKLGMTFIYVTHDQEEAMTMADRIAVMSSGEVLQIGTPEDIYEKPSTRFVADFIGETNFMAGTLKELRGSIGVVHLDGSTRIEAVSADEAVATNSEVTVAIRPEKIGLFPTTGDIRRDEGYTVTATEYRERLQQTGKTTLLEGVVRQALYIGTDTRYTILIGEKTEVIVRVQNFAHHFDTTYKPGEHIYVYWDNENARVLLQ